MELTWDEFKLKVQKHSQLKEEVAENFFEDFERSYYCPKKIVPLEEAKVELNADSFNNFVYDRATGIVLLNLSGAHCDFLNSLYYALSGVEDCYGADRYLEKSMGFYMSSISDTVFKNENTKLTAQERMVFRGFEFESV